MRGNSFFGRRTSRFALLAGPLLLAGFLIPALAGQDSSRATTRSEVIVKDRGELVLAFPGVKGPIPYEKFGRFEGVGTRNYRYVIDDKSGLAKAAGEGIFPNTDASRDPRYRALLKEGQLTGSHWSYSDQRNAELGFYKWATAGEEPGVKQFNTAIMLERAGFIEEAIKAYYAVVVNFPKTVSMTYYKTPWYVSPTALDRVTQLLRRHPNIKMELIGGRIDVLNRYDTDTKNDVYIVDPGKLVAVKKRKPEKKRLLKDKDIVKTVGGPKVSIVKFSNGDWQLRVDGKPFPIRGITYSVTPIGASPDRGTWNVSHGWQFVDVDSDTVHDGFFESYVDKTCSSARPSHENTIGDGRLLKDLGVNTLRAYHHLIDKEIFRKLHKDYGFYLLCGDVLGGYAIGSGAAWYDGTDYTNPEQRKKMLDSVRTMVNEYKDEPYILMWVLGNENIFGVANNSPQKPEVFYQFTNEAAKLIHELDPTRPVAMANGDFAQFDMIIKNCPDIDVFGANAYRGEQGFGRHVYLDVKEKFDRPFLVSEYGTSAYAEGYSKEEAEAFQALYLTNSWEDMAANMAGQGVGNALGGVLFEYMDEWWKANSDLPLSVQREKGRWYDERSATYKNLQPHVQDKVPQFGFPFLDGWSYEEWYGIVSQGDGKDSPYCRVLRPAYFALKELWSKKN